MKYDEIWGSTKHHQLELNKIHQSTSRTKVFFGLYTIPDNFPFIRLLFKKIPIVYNHRFTLEISANSLKLIPNNKFGFLRKAKNINRRISQAITITEIKSISRYKNPEPFIDIFNIEWLLISYSNKNKTHEILLCVGGTYMPHIKSETNKLYERILNSNLVGE